MRAVEDGGVAHSELFGCFLLIVSLVPRRCVADRYLSHDNEWTANRSCFMERWKRQVLHVEAVATRKSRVAKAGNHRGGWKRSTLYQNITIPPSDLL